MKRVTIHDFAPFLLGSVLLLISACAPSLSRFETLIGGGKYKKAAAEAVKDPKDIKLLATALILQDIKNGHDISANIDLLWGSAGCLGNCCRAKKALQQMCREGSSPASDHACIVRAGRRLPRASELDRFLHHDFGEVRARAARKWAHKLKTEDLLSLLGDIEPGTRLAAVQSLADRDRTPPVTEALNNTLLRDPAPSVRSAAAKTGPALGDDALLSLKSALKDENLGVRIAVLQGLAQLRSPAATNILENLAGGPLDEMAVVAIAELRRQGNLDMETRLEAATRSPQLVVRKSALLRLERSQTPNRLPLLKKALQDVSRSVVLLAAQLLAHTKEGQPAAKKALQKLMKSDTLESTPARNLLATLGDPKAIEMTKERLQKGGKTELLGILGQAYRSSSLRKSFAQLMGHEKESVRLAAARACLRLSSVE